ncbi:ABC transporter ATP-binding protein [Methanosarcinales archaeon]|nr:MAG: ABC transporter ATP-binding protein [Methanosarcinales archaeon]
MLQVVNLKVRVEGKKVLNGVSFYLEQGNTYVLFGANGSGKSSLLNTIIGNPKYEVVGGRIIFNDVDITEMSPEERVKLGMGIAFQNPPEVDGVKLKELLEHCRGISGLDREEVEKYIEMLNMEELVERHVNKGFSGGEVKRAEVLQLLVLNPELVMLDEPDSGVDMENLSIMGRALRTLLERDKKKDERTKTSLIITHTGHILQYVDADYGMILHNGRIACIGNPEKILEDITEHGYEGCVDKCLKNVE